VLKNGESGSWISASLSPSDSTHSMITSAYRWPVSGSAASGWGVRKNERFAAHLIDGIPFWPLQPGNVRHRRGNLMHIGNPGGAIGHGGDITAAARPASLSARLCNMAIRIAVKGDCVA
jgi:hypothetical protein